MLIFSLGVSFLIFSLVYLGEGFDWLIAYMNEGDSGYLDTMTNWLVGGGIALAVSCLSLFFGLRLLKENNRSTKADAYEPTQRGPFFNLMNFNDLSGLIALCLIPVSFSFFFSGFIYLREGNIWYWAAESSGILWYYTEASEWYTAQMVMMILGTVFIATAALLLVYNWNTYKTS